jgi:hypothetical protein
MLDMAQNKSQLKNGALIHPGPRNYPHSTRELLSLYQELAQRKENNITLDTSSPPWNVQTWLMKTGLPESFNAMLSVSLQIPDFLRWYSSKGTQRQGFKEMISLMSSNHFWRADKTN